jgi:predicted Abi (CAAX) family protease
MPDLAEILDVFSKTEVRMHEMRRRLVAAVPQLARGRVWCRSCGASRVVDSAVALRLGWPKHCGATMTIDAPEER